MIFRAHYLACLSHASYLINLCGANEDFFRKSVDTASNELRVARL